MLNFMFAIAATLSGTAVQLSQSSVVQESVQTAGSGWTWERVLQTIVVVVIIPLVGVLVKWLNARAVACSKESEKSGVDIKQKLKSQLSETLMRIVSNIAEKQYKELQEAATDGKIDKDELKKLGELAKEQAVTEFKSQGIDIAKELGPEILQSGIRYTVDLINRRKNGDS